MLCTQLMFLKPTHKHRYTVISVDKKGQIFLHPNMYALIGNHCKDSLYYLNVHCIANANIDSFVDDISNLTKDFLVTLSILERGSVRERMDWVARLYDLDGDGFISGDELEDVIFSVGFWPLNPFNCLSANVTAQDPQIIPSL